MNRAIITNNNNKKCRRRIRKRSRRCDMKYEQNEKWIEEFAFQHWKAFSFLFCQVFWSEKRNLEFNAVKNVDYFRLLSSSPKIKNSFLIFFSRIIHMAYMEEGSQSIERPTWLWFFRSWVVSESVQRLLIQRLRSWYTGFLNTFNECIVFNSCQCFNENDDMLLVFSHIHVTLWVLH